jgi:hypothetical protein
LSNDAAAVGEGPRRQGYRGKRGGTERDAGPPFARHSLSNSMTVG